jgi:tetratricopeptide (TPR) repeat protein
MNERFLYLSSVGACLLAGNALYLLASRFPKWQIATIAVTSIFMIGFSLKTMSRNADWYDNYTLFSADAITSDKSAKVKAALAGQLIKLAGEAENKDEEQKLRNEAIELLHASLKIYPKYHVALNMLGDQYLLIDQSDTAQIAPYYRSVIANRMGGQKEASRNLALLYLANGYYEKSVEFYRLARKRDPKNLYLLNRMAEAYLGLGMHDSSIAILKGALEINREYGETYFTLGKVNYDLDKSSDEAISWLEQGLKVDPDNQNIRTLLIQLYAYRGEDDKLRKLESDSGSDTNDEYAIALAKGKAAYAKNDFTAAIKAFKIYYEKYQNTDQVNKNTVFLAMYGKSLMETGDIPGAKAMMELAYANQPDHDFVLRSLGNIAFHYEKNYPKAEKYFEDCVAVNTKEPFTDYTNLGSVCLIQGKKDKALAAYEKAMEYGRSRSVVGNLYLLYKEKGNTEKAAYYNNLLKDPALQ